MSFLFNFVFISSFFIFYSLLSYFIFTVSYHFHKFSQCVYLDTQNGTGFLTLICSGVRIEPSDGLAPSGARPSADTIMTKKVRCFLPSFHGSLQWRHNGRDGVSNHQHHSPLFAHTFIQIKENVKAPRHWPLWGEFTGGRWIPRIKDQ